MKHFILTPFNIQVRPPLNKGLDEAWLRHRIRLFRKFCLPSVVRQTCQAFEWLLFLHPDSPKWLCDELDGLREDCPNMRMHPVDSIGHPVVGSIGRDAIPYIQSLVSAEDLPLITTRLDNDDVILCHFVELVQQAAVDYEGVLVFPRGFCFRASDNKVSTQNDRYNQFISYVEVRTPLKTVRQASHCIVARRGPLKVVSRARMFCWVWHERNATKSKPKRKASVVRGRKWKPARSVPALRELQWLV